MKQFHCRQFTILVFLSLFLVFSRVPPSYRSLAHSVVPELSAWASITPTIDGQISSGLCFGRGGWWAPEYCIRGEWDDAAKVDFNLTYRGEVHDATLYVKNDLVNLYIALKIMEEDYNRLDTLRFEFDNNHDGVREVGDNVFHVSWFYRDAYVDNATSGTIAWDFADGGTRDGIGTAYFTFSEDYHFEIAFPLNTTVDNAHDFSLTNGSTVGFLLKFFDYHSPADVESDVWPSPLYDQMADIRIAEPPAPLPPSLGVDLNISGIEVTQAIQHPNNSLPLVRGKATVVRVTLTHWSMVPLDATVYLYGLDEFGSSLGALSESLAAPRNPDRSMTTHTANFLLPMRWIIRGSLTLTGFARIDSPDQSESNYDNNWIARQSFSLHDTDVPTIYVVPVNCGTREDPDMATDDEISEAEEYLQTVFPVADVNFIRLGWEVIGEDAPRASHRLNDLLTEVGLRLGLRAGGLDQIFGITSKPEPWEWIYGVSEPLWSNEENLAIAASGVPNVAMAHEINHNWGPGALGPGDSWGRHAPGCRAEERGPDDNWPYMDGNISEIGFDTIDMIVVSADTPDFMTYCQAVSPDARKQAWISPYRWENMLYRLDDPIAGIGMRTTQQTGDTLMINGWVSQNGTGSLNSIFPMADANASSSAPGNYSLVLEDSTGNPILTHGLQLDYKCACTHEEEDPWFFTVLLPSPTNTARVLLLYGNTTVLDEVVVSQNVPVVEVISPNGGEEWNASVQTIVWEATDGDSDPLVYRVSYSADNGTTWIPISPILTQTSYQISASSIPGNETALIRVSASDGFNVGLDESDSVFKVVDKPPTARILTPENESLFYTNDVVLLRGRGSDVDDVILPETAYNWTSSADGYLSNGSTSTTMLTPGLHQITLTITDSIGNTCSDTITITVTPGIEITSVTSLKTVVGQELSTSINVTLDNQGPVTRTFNVTTIVSNPPVVTEINPTPWVVVLPPGNSTTLLFTWNTTGVPKGNYTLITLTESVTIDVMYTNGWVVVTIPGDINGDRDVDIFDIVVLCGVYGSQTGDPEYIANCDIDGDGDIDIFDIVIAAGNYGS